MCTWPAASRALKTGLPLQSIEGLIYQNRRQKKRPSYGVRTIELERGLSGYGFTISGQYPCILSCIVRNSPAEQAGLQPGDYLIAVNNINVSKSLHDDVVRLIGNSSGFLQLQIADNYYSDSSDEEVIKTVRSKPKYPNRIKNRVNPNRAEKVVEDLHAGLLFTQNENGCQQHDYKNISDAQLIIQQTFNSDKRPSLNTIENCPIEDKVNTLFSSMRHGQTNRETNDEEAFYRAVVGYLGTIEMPKELQVPRLQAVRNCIRRLRIERKVHTLILLSVFTQKVTLKNFRGLKVAEYPAEKITYSGIYANDKKFFGLVTCNERQTRSSCHVFMVETKMKSHASHIQGATAFNIKCHQDTDNSCCEFPDNAEPILCALSTLRHNRTNEGSFGLVDVALTSRSNTSSNSSNSDSGIGYREEFHHRKDSVFVVHDNSRNSVQLNRENMRQSCISVPPDRIENRLTVRAMPNPIGVNDVPTKINGQRNSFHKYVPNKKTEFRTSIIRPVIAVTPQRFSKTEDKLSPKVYNIDYPTQVTGKDFLAGTVSDNCYDSSSETGREEVDIAAKPSEKCSESCDSDVEEVWSEVDTKWMRVYSHQRGKQVSPHFIEVDVGSEFGEFTNGKLSPSNKMLGLEVNNSKTIKTQGTRVANWSLSFDKLLEDPAGVHTFAIFLKREFSYENIHFWVACERYRKFANTQELMKEKAKEIFQRHLCNGASEPVNVDSKARQIAEDGLQKPSMEIFTQAQKQIYNLMKFDCYLRFLKSPVYKDNLVNEVPDELLMYSGNDDLDPSLPYEENNKLKNKKEKNGFEERRRKSLLSWNRKKSDNQDSRQSTKKKTKERKEENASDINGSRSSLANGDLTVMQRCTSSRESLHGIETNGTDESCTLCRILLPDHSTAVVQTKADETVFNVLKNLFERRNLNYTAIDVFWQNSDKTINLNEDSRILGGSEIQLEERVIFRITLPNKKILIVKHTCDQSTGSALNFILNRYGFKMDSIVLTTTHNQMLDLSLPIRNLNRLCLVVELREKQSEWGSDAVLRRKNDELDSVTGFFDDVIGGKLQLNWDEFGVWDSDRIDTNCEKTTLERRTIGILGLPRRNSVHFERDFKKLKNKNRASVHEALNHRIIPAPVTDKPPIPKTKKQSENDDLYHVWERAQRSRLDDQRGTEINFEMPDFLKPQSKKVPLEIRTSDSFLLNSKQTFNEPQFDCSNVNCFTGNSIIPTLQQAEDFFSAKSAAYINFNSRDEGVNHHCTRKDVTLTRPSSHQLDKSKPNMERMHSFPSRKSVKSPPPNESTMIELSRLLKTRERSLTPSRILPPAESNDTSLHVEEANFTPPPRLQLPTPPDTPPPLPPKPKNLPPRPHFMTKKLPVMQAAVPEKSSSESLKTKEEVGNHNMRSRRAMYIERELGDKFSISFV